MKGKEPVIESESEFAMKPESNTILTYRVKYYREGVGPVIPTGEVNDAELLREVENAQLAIEHPAKVCIDERPAVETQPIRAKMPGGNLTVGFMAAELAGWSLYTDEQRESGVELRVQTVADHLVAADEVLGGHIDNHADERTTKCNCGAVDGCPDHTQTIAEHGNDIQFIDQMQDVLGKLFDDEVHQEIITTAKSKVEAQAFKGWSGWFIIRAIQVRNGTVEVLDGSNLQPEKDPTNARRNHWAEGVGKNTVAGKSNNRDGDGIRFFQVDIPAVVETCQRMAKDEAELVRLLHAAVAFTLAVRFNLTSDQPTVTVG